jgi:hypothetical protein
LPRGRTLELAQRFPHRHAAHVVFLRERVLDQRVTFPELSVEDAFLERFRQRLGQALPLDLVRCRPQKSPSRGQGVAGRMR